MTFIPPAFETFKISTLNLKPKYSLLLERYNIMDGTISGASTSCLEVLIARTNDVITCKTDRESQVEVFNLLVNELRQIPKENEKQIEQGALFLLGALIHRYFRLIKEYDDFNSYASWTYFGKCEVTSCRLFLSIRKALQFKEIEVVKKRFREEDLKILDAVTAVEALETFRDNMLMENKDKVPQYMKYPHFAKDENFKQYLGDMIKEQTKRGEGCLRRFKAIHFVQSLAIQIEEERKEVEKDIEKWCKAIAKDYKDFNAFQLLNDVAILESIMKHVKSERARNIIFKLFYTPHIQDSLATTGHSTFVTKMKECHNFTCSFMLFGGYVLLLQQPNLLDSDLLFTIQQALGLEKSLDELTNDDMRNGVKFLREYLEIEPAVSNDGLDYEFFGGKEKMKAAITRAEKELTLPKASQKEDNEIVFTY
ncbi:hypothetical protein [Legionella sp. 227]|uniref:hypothetical protein n=1 Tax=Legionella sp. 227 TaxID=3367288 RepID=UPI00370D1E43